jgi:hypothetical protein
MSSITYGKSDFRVSGGDILARQAAKKKEAAGIPRKMHPVQFRGQVWLHSALHIKEKAEAFGPACLVLLGGFATSHLRFVALKYRQVNRSRRHCSRRGSDKSPD